MQIAKSIQENLESQLKQYENLLELAGEKSVLFSRTDRRPVEVQTLVTKETTVVSTLKHLESERQSICGDKDFHEIVEVAGDFKEPLLSIKEKLKGASLEIKKLNEKNKLMLETSLKIIGKMIRAVKNLTVLEEPTYSRIQKPSKIHTSRSVNLRA
jgi:flagellar biosynthesis/type III secretory pathway chaperone